MTDQPGQQPSPSEEQQRELLRSVRALEVDPPAPDRDGDAAHGAAVQEPAPGAGRAGDDGV